MLDSFTKDPQAILDYTVEWSDWLASDTLATSSWSSDVGLTIEGNPAPSNTTTAATVWLSGGTAGQDYRVTNTIVTNGGRTEQRTILIMARER